MMRNKMVGAVLFVGLTLAGCSAPAPEPKPTEQSMTFQECAKMGFDMLKEQHGAKYLVAQKEKATASVREMCDGLPMK